MLYLGIDSGATKAAFLLMDEQGNVMLRHREPGCAVLGARKAGVKRMVENGLAAMCEKAGVRKDEIRALGLGINGYGEGDGTEQETMEACEEAFFPGRCVCSLDTYVGWAGSLLFDPGINIIAGTGSVVYGVAADGRTARAGGWGARCDEGSCSWHGQRVVEAFTKQADGRMPRTALYELFRERFHIEGDDSHFVMPLNREVVRDGKGLADLQYLLHDAYELGDPAAKAIYELGAQELFLGVKAVAQRLGLTRAAVSYSGGLFKSGACILEPLDRLVTASGGRLVVPCYEPDVGAVMMAIRFVNPKFDAHAFTVRDKGDAQ